MGLVDHDVRELASAALQQTLGFVEEREIGRRPRGRRILGPEDQLLLVRIENPFGDAGEHARLGEQRAAVDDLARGGIGEQLGAEVLLVEAERDPARVHVVDVVNQRAPEPLALRGHGHIPRAHRVDHRVQLRCLLGRDDLGPRSGQRNLRRGEVLENGDADHDHEHRDEAEVEDAEEDDREDDV